MIASLNAGLSLGLRLVARWPSSTTPWYLASMVPLDGYIEKGLLALAGP